MHEDGLVKNWSALFLGQMTPMSNQPPCGVHSVFSTRKQCRLPRIDSSNNFHSLYYHSGSISLCYFSLFRYRSIESRVATVAMVTRGMDGGLRRHFALHEMFGEQRGSGVTDFEAAALPSYSSVQGCIWYATRLCIVQHKRAPYTPRRISRDQGPWLFMHRRAIMRCPHEGRRGCRACG